MRLDDFIVGEIVTSYTADTWDDAHRVWVPYLYQDKWRYFYPDVLETVKDELKARAPTGIFRIFRHDTTRQI